MTALKLSLSASSLLLGFTDHADRTTQKLVSASEPQPFSDMFGLGEELSGTNRVTVKTAAPPFAKQPLSPAA